MQQPVPHFVVTRLAMGIYDEDRLNRLVDLFEAITLPSILNQSSREFVWLVTVDSACPQNILSRIAELVANHQNFYIVRIDVSRLLNVHLACFDWVWDHCQEHILQNRLLEDPDHVVITSILDADDAWHRDVVATVNETVAAQLPKLASRDPARGTWLRHTSGLTITFPHGYAWFLEANKIWPLQQEFRSMAVFVASRFSSGISACSCRHTKWRQFADVLEFEVVALTKKEPMWIYCRHGEAVGQWDSRPAMPMPAGFNERFERSYGVDLAKLAIWREKHPSGQSPEKGFDSSAAEQFDLFFRIAGLNRKIQALEAGNSTRPGEHSAELERTRSLRQSLVEQLRKA